MLYQTNKHIMTTYRRQEQKTKLLTSPPECYVKKPEPKIVINVEQTKCSNNEFDKDIVFVDEINSDLISNLKHALICTFLNDTEFKLFVSNDNKIIGIKCMVLKRERKNLEKERTKPHLLLEIDKLYSEENGDFHVFYYVYNPELSKIFILVLNESVQIKKISDGIVFNVSTRKHINLCLDFYRELVRTNFIL